MSITILALGDSLTEGYGIPKDTAFPAVLENLLREKHYNVSLVNLGLSGDTTAGGLQRLLRYLANNPVPDAAIVELGANDAFANTPPEEVYNTLDTILSIFMTQKVPVLFAGMYALFEKNENYAKKFNAVFPKLTQKYTLLYYPFFLEGVWGNPDFMLWDELHPNITGTALIAENILPLTEKLIACVK